MSTLVGHGARQQVQISCNVKSYPTVEHSQARTSGRASSSICKPSLQIIVQSCSPLAAVEARNLHLQNNPFVAAFFASSCSVHGHRHCNPQFCDALPMRLRHVERTMTPPSCTKHATTHQCLFCKILVQIHQQTVVYTPTPKLLCLRVVTVGKEAFSMVYVPEEVVYDSVWNTTHPQQSRSR